MEQLIPSNHKTLIKLQKSAQGGKAERIHTHRVMEWNEEPIFKPTQVYLTGLWQKTKGNSIEKNSLSNKLC